MMAFRRDTVHFFTTLLFLLVPYSNEMVDDDCACLLDRLLSACSTMNGILLHQALLDVLGLLPDFFRSEVNGVGVE